MKMLYQVVMDNLNLGKTRHQHIDVHLAAAMEWLRAAQDAGSDDGVARMYHIRNGWGASYPETTGYIIPTFIDYAHYVNDKSWADRALRMADWETAVQMEDGAVQGGTIKDKPSPAIFNTGQVLFGWCAAYRYQNEQRYRKSLQRAADYLMSHQDEDGAWRRNLSAFTSAPVDSYAYNTRTAWALGIAGKLTENQDYLHRCAANMSYVLGLADTNGWIAKNCLNDPDVPLLHTIAYAYQGLLEGSLITGQSEVTEFVARANIHLLNRMKKDGLLYGRYDRNWVPAVKWRCLTGEAQTSIVWQRLAEITGDREWADAAYKLNRLLMATQRLSGPAGIYGGIKGSHPINGWYGKYQYLNWAAKFFVDALLLENGVKKASVSG